MLTTTTSTTTEMLKGKKKSLSDEQTNGHCLKNGNNHRCNEINAKLDNSYKNLNKNVSSQQLNQGENGGPDVSDEFGDEFDGLLHKDTNNSMNTLQMLNVLRKSRQLCDLVLQLDDDSQEIYCHQIILACNSKFFMEIFNSYEIEEKNICRLEELAATLYGDKQEEMSNEISDLKKNLKRNSMRTVLNKNNTNPGKKQLFFCLSDYLRNFLSESYHRHYNKINNILLHNHSSHFHHAPVESAVVTTGNGQDNKQINNNLDFEALKLCIDYFYTSQLKVPCHLLPHVYTLAYHLSFDNIVNICAQYLTNHMNVNNCLSIRSFALDENLIQSSTECIEKNIEYILQLGPMPGMRSMSASMSSLNNLSSKQSPIEAVNDLTSSTLSLTSANHANQEFNHLPRVNIELVGMSCLKYKLPDNLQSLTELCMNWIVEELDNKTKSAEHTLEYYCDNLNMLYMNNEDHTLHDCSDMDSADANFNDNINDYQKQSMVVNSQMNGCCSNGVNGSGRRSRQSPPVIESKSTSPSPGLITSKLKTFKLTEQELKAAGTATPIRLKVLHDNEVICTHQTSENSFITICTLSGKLVTLNVHILPCQALKVDMEVFLNEAKSLGESDLDTPLRKSTQDVSKLTNSEPSQMNAHSNTSAPILHRSASTNSIIDQEKMAKMFVPRCSHGLIEYEKKLYIIGGYDRGECLNLCEIYEPMQNTSTQMEPMPNRRGRAAITWFSSKKSIFVMGGSNGHEDLNSIECYDMVKKVWSTIKFDFELDCSNSATTACDNFIYLVGLKGHAGNIHPRISCLKYEPSTNAFSRIAELNHGRSQSAIVCIPSDNGNNHVLYVFGGYDKIRCLSSCELYNPAEDRWVLIPSMHEPRRGCGAAYHRESQSIYIVGGTNGTQSLKTVEIFNMATKKWTAGPELNTARTNVSIAFIGNILFAVGGFDGKSFLRTIEYLNCNKINNGWSMYYKQADFLN